MSNQVKFKVGDIVIRTVNTMWSLDMGLKKGNLYKVIGFKNHSNIIIEGYINDYEAIYFIKATKLEKVML